MILISQSEPIEITTFGYVIDDECERIYYVIKRRAMDSFLENSHRPLAIKAWTLKPEKAARWVTQQAAHEFAQKVFTNISLDTE